MADDPKNYDGWLSRTPGNNQPEQPISRENIGDWFNYVFKENGGPGYDSALVNMLRGIRILGPGNSMAPIPDDTIGLAFASRPMLNLSDYNVQKHPQLQALVKPARNSFMAYIKGLLDPVWGAANSGDNTALDPLNPWIPPMTNFLKVSSGFPDLSLAVGKSSPGFRGETYSFVDGILKVNFDFDIRQSYYNTKPNFMPYLFEVWVHYIEAVTLGDEGMEPNWEALECNYLDYTTRIYHIIMNKNMRNIEWIFCCGGCFPTTFPSGAFSTIDRTQNTLRGQGQDELEINFAAQGFRFSNLQIADQFNRTTLRTNPNMHPSVRSRYYKKMPFRDYYLSGYGSYPWINLDTMEMEYWGIN